MRSPPCSPLIEHTHGMRQPAGHIHAQQFHTSVDPCGHLRPFRGTKRPQHIVHLSALRKIRPNTKTNACIGLGAQRFLYVSQSVVATRASLTPQPESPHGQAQIVGNHQQLLHPQPLRPQPIPYRLPTQIHVGRRLQQQQLMPGTTQRGMPAISSCFKSDGRMASTRRQSVEYHKTNVVAGLGIFRTRIAQSHNQKLHDFRAQLAPTPQLPVPSIHVG